MKPIFPHDNGRGSLPMKYATMPNTPYFPASEMPWDEDGVSNSAHDSDTPAHGVEEILMEGNAARESPRMGLLGGPPVNYVVVSTGVTLQHTR